MKIECCWVHKTGKKGHLGTDEFKPAIDFAVPEKCLKGRAISSHATYVFFVSNGEARANMISLGPAERLHGPATYSEVTYPYSKDPIAVFVFKYRSRSKLYPRFVSNLMADFNIGDLQVEGVIPRSPSPLPLEQRDPDDLSPEEARELVRRLRQREQERIKIKKEAQEKRARSDAFDGDSDVEELPVTGEGSARKRHRPSTDSGVEIVDLTED